MFTHEINVQSSSNRDIVWVLSSKLVALTSLMSEQVIPLSTMYSSHNHFWHLSRQEIVVTGLFTLYQCL